MELMFEIISRHKFSQGIQPTHIFSEVGGVIGRSETCEWCLRDKNKRISRQHALISCDGKHFYLEDRSSNGIISPLTKLPIAKGQRHIVEHGESFIVGDYTIQARLLHKPDTYLQPSLDMGDSIISDDAQLDMDPLVAMEQQDSFIAKQRLGIYNNLLGDMVKSAPQTADHSEPRLDILPSVTAIPENWAEASRGVRNVSQPAPLPIPASSAAPEIGDYAIPRSNTAPAGSPYISDASSPGNRQETSVPVNAAPAVNMFHPLVNEHPHVAGNPGPDLLPDQARQPATPQPETDLFFKALGFSSSPATQEERERMLLQAAELLHAFADGMLEALHNRADTKNELRLPVTTVRMAGNNPLKFSPTTSGAMEYLLGAEQPNLLPAKEAVKAAFHDLHAHNLGLLAGARAAVRGVLKSVSPESAEARLDADGPVHVRRTARLWHTYIKMHQALLNDNDGFSAFFLNDFSRAYAMQQHTLNPYPANMLKGAK